MFRDEWFPLLLHHPVGVYMHALEASCANPTLHLVRWPNEGWKKNQSYTNLLAQRTVLFYS